MTAADGDMEGATKSRRTGKRDGRKGQPRMAADENTKMAAIDGCD